MSEVKHKVIAVNYNLLKDGADGEMIESTEGRQPLVFLSGMNQMLPEFENNVSHLKVGDVFSFGIKSDDAYGKRDESAQMELPKNMFENEGKLVEEIAVGNVLPLQDQDGNVHPGKILEVKEEVISFDMNHPLAEQDLHFTGSVIEIREATSEEIEHKHVHGPDGHEH